MSPQDTALTLVLAYNVIVGLVYAYDKRAAIRDRRRIRERTLMLLAVAFGAPGAWVAMRACRHKTHKPKFKVGVPALLLLQAFVVALASWEFYLRR